MTVSEVFENTVAAILADPVFQDVEVVTKSARRQGAGTELRLMIDRRTGVDVSLCEAVARYVNSALADQTALYTLEVESAGLERPLVRESDYERFQGRNICVKTHKLWEGAKTHRGVLLGLSDGRVSIQSENGPLEIPYAGIKQANLEFDVRAALRGRPTDAPAGPPQYKKRENQQK